MPFIGNDRIAKVRAQPPMVVRVEFKVFIICHCVCPTLFVASTFGAAPNAASGVGTFPLPPLALVSAKEERLNRRRAVWSIPHSVTLYVRGASPKDNQIITVTVNPSELAH